MKKSLFLLSFLSLLLVACNPASHTSSEQNYINKDIDLNTFTQDVEFEYGVTNFSKAYNNYLLEDDLRVVSDFENFKLNTKVYSIDGQSVESEEGMFGSFSMDSRITGLQATDPNDIKASFQGFDMNITFDGEGYNSDGTDRLVCKKAKFSQYLIDNKAYYDISNPEFRKMLPIVLLKTDSELKTIDEAKVKAEEYPNYFYKDEPVANAENLPLLNKEKLPTEQQFKDGLLEFAKNHSDIVSFKSNTNNDTLVTISLKNDEIIDIICEAVSKQNPDVDISTLKFLISAIMSFNRCNFNLVFNEQNEIYYQDVEIDFSFKNVDSETKKTTRIAVILQSKSYIDLNDFEVVIPENLSEYQKLETK